MVRLAWILLALIHALPAIALVRPSLLTTLYGVEPQAPAFILLWHRAGFVRGDPTNPLLGRSSVPKCASSRSSR